MNRGCGGMVSVRAYPGKSRDGPVRCSGEAFSTRITIQNGTDFGFWNGVTMVVGGVLDRGEGEDGWMSKDHSKIEFLS